MGLEEEKAKGFEGVAYSFGEKGNYLIIWVICKSFFMSVEEQDYKFEVLEYAVNQCIDRLLPSSSEDALGVILYQSNEVVWRVATEIYTKSGHQVDFVFVRDIMNLRVEPLRKKITEEKIFKEKQARIRAELEAQRLAQIAEEERLKKEREAELARIRAEQERIKKEKEAEEARIRKKREQEELRKFQEKYPGIEIDNYRKLILFKKIFPRIKNIIVKNTTE